MSYKDILTAMGVEPDPHLAFWTPGIWDILFRQSSAEPGMSA